MKLFETKAKIKQLNRTLQYSILTKMIILKLGSHFIMHISDEDSVQIYENNPTNLIIAQKSTTQYILIIFYKSIIQS